MDRYIYGTTPLAALELEADYEVPDEPIYRRSELTIIGLPAGAYPIGVIPVVEDDESGDILVWCKRIS